MLFPFVTSQLERFYFQKDIFKFVRKPDGIHLDDGNFVKLSLSDFRKIDKIIDSGGKAAIFNAYCLQKVFSKGPKVLRLNAVDFEVLENLEVNLQVGDYAQPYEALIVQFPEDYQKKCLTMNPTYGMTNAYTGEVVDAKEHCPHSVIVVHDLTISAIVVTVIMSSNDCLSMMLGDTESTLESQLEHDTSELSGSLPVTDAEGIIFVNAIRAALNACLYVEDFGLKKLGPKSPKHKEKLQRHVDNADNPEKLRKAKRELLSYPTYYELSQEVKFQVTKGERSINRGQSGIELAPHWRKGHYRMQPHGPGGTLRKRIRIHATLVNGYKFAGELKDTKVTLHD